MDTNSVYAEKMPTRVTSCYCQSVLVNYRNDKLYSVTGHMQYTKITPTHALLAANGTLLRQITFMCSF